MTDASQWPAFVPKALIEWASSDFAQSIYFHGGDRSLLHKLLRDERMAPVYKTLRKSQPEFVHGDIAIALTKTVHDAILSALEVRSHEWMKAKDLSSLKAAKRLLSDKRLPASAGLAVEAIEKFEADLARSLRIFDFDHKQRSHAMWQAVIKRTDNIEPILVPAAPVPNIYQSMTTQKLNTKSGLGAYIARYLTAFFLSASLRPHYAETGIILEILLDEKTAKYTEGHVRKMAAPAIRTWKKIEKAEDFGS